MANGKWQMAKCGKCGKCGKCKRVLKTLGLVLLIFITFSCNLNNSNLSDTTIKNDSKTGEGFIPYASDEELERGTKSSDVVDYKLVRKLLKIDFELGLKETYDWEGAEISEKPVLIYDSECKPQYYEFIVKTDSEPIGTITTYATKASTDVVSYVIPWVRDYSTYLTKANEYSLFSEGYPTRMVCGVLGKAGETPSIAVDIDSGNSVELQTKTSKELLLEQIESLTQEELQEMELENWQEEFTATEEKIEEENEDAAEYWQAVEAYKENFLALTDKEIEEEYNETKWKDYNYKTTYDTYIIPAYNSDGMKRTRWNGWCVPSAICWVYRGLYSSYKGTRLPLYGDSDFEKPSYRKLESGDKVNGIVGVYNIKSIINETLIKHNSNNADGGLYYEATQNSDFYRNAEKTGKGSIFFFYCSRIIRSVTNNRYRGSFTFFRKTVHDHIRKNKLPALIRGNGHCRVGFGSRYKKLHWTRKYRFLWWTWTSRKSKTTNKQWLIQDNGYDTRHHDFLPFWSDSKNYSWIFNVRVRKNNFF